MSNEHVYLSDAIYFRSETVNDLPNSLGTHNLGSQMVRLQLVPIFTALHNVILTGFSRRRVTLSHAAKLQFYCAF